MPTYAYRCNDCGYEFEVRQRMSDDPLTDCPNCAGEIRRVVNSVGVVFKGSGFYITDNRNGKSSAAARSTTASTTDSPAAAEGGESKPAAEKESKPADSSTKSETSTAVK